MMRMQSDLVELCLAALDGHLDDVDAQWDERTALGVVMAAGGYPESYRKGDAIEGLLGLDEGDCKVFHAGTVEDNGMIVTSGGRVLCVCALGDDVSAARDRAYACVDTIHWPDAFFRTDIGHRALGREK
jgi:phosphoribosylamine--glycine ligase